MYMYYITYSIHVHVHTLYMYLPFQAGFVSPSISPHNVQSVLEALSLVLLPYPAIVFHSLLEVFDF